MKAECHSSKNQGKSLLVILTTQIQECESGAIICTNKSFQQMPHTLCTTVLDLKSRNLREGAITDASVLLSAEN